MGQDANEGYGNFSIFSLFFLTDFSRFFFWGCQSKQDFWFFPHFPSAGGLWNANIYTNYLKNAGENGQVPHAQKCVILGHSEYQLSAIRFLDTSVNQKGKGCRLKLAGIWGVHTALMCVWCSDFKSGLIGEYFANIRGEVLEPKRIFEEVY